MEIAVVGSGYVGLVAGACFAESGNDVICVDIDEEKVAALTRGEIPIFEPGLEELITRNVGDGRLSFTTDLKSAIQKSQVIFIAVGTPQDEDGSADLQHVLAVARGIGEHMNGYKVIVDKSTVPVGTAEKVSEAISALTSHEFDVVSNPEFLKEGAALDDFLKPDRVVVGVASEKARRVMQQLYAPFVRTNNPILFMDVPSAELTKYAANAMLAARVSFMNEIALLAERAGADINDVRIGIGTDSRIGMSFLFPGCGYGGSCFPKDVQALIKTGRDFGVELQVPIATEAVNMRQKNVLVDKVLQHYSEDLSNKTFAVWGLSFKPRTDDVREAPALVICRQLIDRGASLHVTDPEGMENFRRAFGESDKISYFENNYESLDGANGLIICTEWNEFRNPNFGKVKEALIDKVIFDGRNLYKTEVMQENGFAYYSIGRVAVGV